MDVWKKKESELESYLNKIKSDREINEKNETKQYMVTDVRLFDKFSRNIDFLLK